ncbi:SinR family protein [Paraburkholderia solisilvae]|uniref:SinR family protein n=1 Tax=Paraburkholderia solisilvae TaxID=624376 RepID=A0A6J5EMI7_9BURK|nr:SinR family protein [Paraburkholderia solisilvae]CAB3766456.1 hypothetical protein LMG29739_04835 [Paraburkholderia solisilvae]
MTTYIVGYDLTRKDGHDYTNLIDALKGFPNWWHCLDSTWIIISNQTSVEIRDALMTHMHKDDRLLVAQHTGSAAWFGFNDNCSDWLRKNL